jgi:hypothetical protein
VNNSAVIGCEMKRVIAGEYNRKRARGQRSGGLAEAAAIRRATTSYGSIRRARRARPYQLRP